MYGFWLKLLAMASMLVDHTGMVLFPQMQGLRLIGRLAFPLYCFLMAEGAAHTSNIKRYLGRLLVFAMLSEIPYDLACRNTIFIRRPECIFYALFRVARMRCFKTVWAAKTAFRSGRGGLHGAARANFANGLRCIRRAADRCILCLPLVPGQGRPAPDHPEYRIFFAEPYDASADCSACRRSHFDL